ncbi:DUF3310 domain-containing protein [Streptomyces sp. NPDC001832]|uniref:DUF3310 domain-containing protein n=1 Tax=Streptomyces sp. NPDC001832 TaxID=3154527 RepID=UPI00332D7032
MKFKPGEVVVISDPSTAFTEQFRDERAVVTDFKEDESYPYEVVFANGFSLGFADFEMSRVEDQAADEINHPTHYTWLPNGLEVIDVTENLNFNLGNVVKYALRAGHKTEEPLTDLRKAAWYINREIDRLESA